MSCIKRNKKPSVTNANSLNSETIDNRVRYMRPNDIKPYTDLPPQAIRELLKQNMCDFGFVINPTGKRYNYYIFPKKFFSWLGKDVPEEWKPAAE